MAYDMALMIEKIVSGGQTGVDRAALDVALALGMPCSGWCPQGRRAEDGVIPARYPLTETGSGNYALRTEWNVRDADATLIINAGPLDGGTRLTAVLAGRLGKPCLVLDADGGPEPERVLAWLREHDVRVLNVAGPRESGRPGIYRRAVVILREVFAGNRTNRDVECEDP